MFNAKNGFNLFYLEANLAFFNVIFIASSDKTSQLKYWKLLENVDSVLRNPRSYGPTILLYFEWIKPLAVFSGQSYSYFIEGKIEVTIWLYLFPFFQSHYLWKHLLGEVLSVSDAPSSDLPYSLLLDILIVYSVAGSKSSITMPVWVYGNVVTTVKLLACSFLRSTV